MDKVGTAKIQAGNINRGTLPVAFHPDGKIARIPVIAIKGTKRGPTVGLIAGAHGDELNGPETVYRFLKQLDVKKLHGTLLVLPIMNPWGFADKQRQVSIDFRDLNRSYPGSKQGSFSYQVAENILNNFLNKVDFAIDVHDAGRRRVLLPHAIAHIKPKTDETRKMALAFGFDAIVVREPKLGMLAGEAKKKFKKPVVTIEIGGAMRLWEPFLNRAVTGINNILKYKGVLKGVRTVPDTQLVLQRKHDNPTEMSGLLTSWVTIGEVVKKGQPLYRIHDPISGKEIIHKARFCGIVIAINVLAHVKKGDEGISLVKFISCRQDITTVKGQVVKNREKEGVRLIKSVLSQAHKKHQ